MKNLLLFLILLLNLNLYSQIIPKEDLKPIIIKSTLLFISGGCDATSEVLRINYSQFEKVHTKANEQYWNPKVSYVNKWKNGDYTQGEKFFLSSTALVWTTDGYHMLRMIRNSTMITAIVIPIGKRKNWKQYAAEAIIYYGAYTTGFNLMYNGVYKMP